MVDFLGPYHFISICNFSICSTQPTEKPPCGKPSVHNDHTPTIHQSVSPCFPRLLYWLPTFQWLNPHMLSTQPRRKDQQPCQVQQQDVTSKICEEAFLELIRRWKSQIPPGCWRVPRGQVDHHSGADVGDGGFTILIWKSLGTAPYNYGKSPFFIGKSTLNGHYEIRIQTWSHLPLWKNMSSSVGMMKFPIYGKIKNVPNHQPVSIWKSLGYLLTAWSSRIHKDEDCEFSRTKTHATTKSPKTQKEIGNFRNRIGTQFQLDVCFKSPNFTSNWNRHFEIIRNPPFSSMMFPDRNLHRGISSESHV